MLFICKKYFTSVFKPCRIFISFVFSLYNYTLKRSKYTGENAKFTNLTRLESVGNVTAQLDETQHRTGSLYGSSSKGVDWPTQLFRQRPVLGLQRRARGTST